MLGTWCSYNHLFYSNNKIQVLLYHLQIQAYFVLRQKDVTAEFNYFHLQWRREIINIFLFIIINNYYVFPILKTEYS